MCDIYLFVVDRTTLLLGKLLEGLCVLLASRGLHLPGHFDGIYSLSNSI